MGAPVAGRSDRPGAGRCCNGCASARTPTSRSGCATSTRMRSRRSSAPPGSSSACSTTRAGGRLSAALRRSFSSLEIPNYRRYFAGQIVSVSGNWMQMVAEMWLILALTGSGVAVGRDRRASVPADAPVRRLGRRARRPVAEALAADRHAADDGAAGAGAVRALTAAGVVEPWMVFALVFVRGSVNAIDNPTRQSFVIEMVGADRVVNAVGLNSVLDPLGADPRAGRGRDPDRDPRRRPLLSDQRAHLRRDDRRASRHGPDELLRSPQAPDTDDDGGPGRAPLRPRRAVAADPARDDGHRRDPGVQLPGPAAVARPLHASTEAPPPTPRSRSRWRSARSAARSPPAPGAASANGLIIGSAALFGVAALVAVDRADARRSSCSRWSRSAPPASPSPPAVNSTLQLGATRRCAAG